MDGRTITQFYSEDHARLDSLFEQFEKLKDKEPDQAINVLEEFKAGLEQHMAWEEAILFSEYDARLSSGGEESVTADLLSEHEQIREYLEALWAKVRKNDSDTKKESARLTTLLAEHNLAEEQGIYPNLDHLLTDIERAQICQRMKDAAFG